MDSILVQGGIALQGKVRIQGSKNAALPILAACTLIQEPIFLENCPKIADVYGMLRILESLGCLVRWEKDGLRVDASGLVCGTLPQEAVTGMRSSIFLLGALLARCGQVTLEHPGGCVIGKRPIDLHLKALRSMGVTVEETPGGLNAAAQGLRGAEIMLDFPSVGATENLLMAAVAAEGKTRIAGAAREPEVQALCEFLCGCGADIRGIGTDTLTVEGGLPLRGASYRIPADRIVAGTYLFAGFAAGGSVFLEDAPVRHMDAVLDTAEKMGAVLTVTKDGIYVQCPERAEEFPYLQTDVYPGFPTDLQSVFLAVRCSGKGSTVIRENIFEDRFRVVPELQNMGGSILLLGDKEVKVSGVSRLHGANTAAQELRGGAALVVAALGANGMSTVSGRKFIERGYENISRDLRELGARIVSE